MGHADELNQVAGSPLPKQDELKENQRSSSMGKRVLGREVQ